MNYEDIIYEKENGIATITLNRPKALNALTGHMLGEIADAIDQVAMDDEVRTLVITGAGRGFCAGDDLKELANPPPAREGKVNATNAHQKELADLPPCPRRQG